MVVLTALDFDYFAHLPFPRGPVTGDKAAGAIQFLPRLWQFIVRLLAPDPVPETGGGEPAYVERTPCFGTAETNPNTIAKSARLDGHPASGTSTGVASPSLTPLPVDQLRQVESRATKTLRRQYETVRIRSLLITLAQRCFAYAGGSDE